MKTKNKHLTVIKDAIRKTATFLFVLLISFISIFLLLSQFTSSILASFCIFLLPPVISYFVVRFLEKRRVSLALKKQEEDIQSKESYIQSRERYLQSLNERCKAEEARLKAILVESLKTLAQLREAQVKYSHLMAHNSEHTLAKVDAMDGHTFEYWCAEILSKNGFSNVSVTPGSGDHGVDVLAEKDGIRYAVQCKCYSHDLGNTPVQEVYAGKEMYRCQVGVVMTNRYFTAGAKALAEQTRVLLWDRDKLQSLIASAE